MNTKEFLASPYRNAWVTEDHMGIYVRKGVHCINGKSASTFDIATIEIEEGYQGKGLFTAYLARLTLDGFEYVYVENVLEEEFRVSLRKKGFIEVNSRFTDLNSGFELCFYRKVT